jgi:hypothetical protein
MPKASVPLSNISELVSGFVAAVERATVERMKQLVLGALGGSGGVISSSVLGRVRRQLPKQLCPVPGCENVAAPVFGMVCRDHKDVPKAQIKKYREERRAAAEGAPAVRRGRPPGKRTPKKAKAPRKAAARRLPAAAKGRGRKDGRQKATRTAPRRKAVKKGRTRQVAAKAAPPPVAPSTAATSSSAAASA